MANRRQTDLIYKIRDPETGLFLAKKVNRWTDKSWSEHGAIYLSADKAWETIDHFMLMTLWEGQPLEVVGLKITEETAASNRYPRLVKLHDFAHICDGRAVRTRYHGDGDEQDPVGNIWYSVKPRTMLSFVYNLLKKGQEPRYVIRLSGTHNPVKELNLRGYRSCVRWDAIPITFVAVFDDAALVALKLRHTDDILQVFDYEKVILIEGDQHALYER